MKHKAVVLRLKENDKQTLGRFFLFNDLEQIFSCVVLELPDRDNKTNISNIPAGKYIAKIRWSEKYDWHYILEDVEGRSYILLHFGNYYFDTRGCLLLGNDFRDLNKDGVLDVTSSKKTMSKLMSFGINEFELTIKELF